MRFSPLGRTRTALSILIGLALLSGCEPSPDPASPAAGAMESRVPAPDTFLTVGPAVGNDPATFADNLRRISNQNEVMIVYRSTGSPPMDHELLASVVDDSMSALAPSFEAGPGSGRATPGFAESGSTDEGRILSLLADHGVEPYRPGGSFPVIYARLPDDGLRTLVRDLLGHPNVDYIEGNRRRQVVPDAEPVGSNPDSIKHRFHRVLAAWDSTRGGGAEVGILDSGLAWDSNASEFHEDAQDFSASGYGVVAKGFVDDYAANCNPDSGGCIPYDDSDVAHGSGAVGLAGANDNSLGFVGIMPFGITYSLRVAFNENNQAAGTCDAQDPDFCLEDDDVTAGVDWSAANGLDVLSASFSTDLGATVFNAMSDGYNIDDVLILSSTGNDPGAGPRSPAVELRNGDWRYRRRRVESRERRIRRGVWAVGRPDPGWPMSLR